LPPELVPDHDDVEGILRLRRVLDARDHAGGRQKQRHDDQYGNDRPRELHLVAAVHLRRFGAVVVPPPPEAHDRVDQQAEDDREDTRCHRQHEHRQLEDGVGGRGHRSEDAGRAHIQAFRLSVVLSAAPAASASRLIRCVRSGPKRPFAPTPRTTWQFTHAVDAKTSRPLATDVSSMATSRCVATQRSHWSRGSTTTRGSLSGTWSSFAVTIPSSGYWNSHHHW